MGCILCDNAQLMYFLYPVKKMQFQTRDKELLILLDVIYSNLKIMKRPFIKSLRITEIYLFEHKCSTGQATEV